jgi:hypothetical protein
MSGPQRVGPELFADQLRAKGVEVVVDGGWVEFNYEVPGGSYAGASVQMAILVPAQFPATTPHGIDFSPRMPDRPIATNAPHPKRSHPSKRFGPEGEHWSRPYQGWNKEKVKDANTYMVWVQSLWMTT